MSQHISFFNERLAAIWTAVWTFVRMGSSVGDQVPFTHEVLRAEIATKWSLGVASFVMRTHVEEQVTLQWETLAALRAYEWTFTSMTAHMIYEMFLPCKWFRADVTTVRRISGMLTEMIIEVFFPGERSLTEFTSVRRFASVDSYMIRQVLLTSK